MSNPYIIVKTRTRENTFYQIFERCTDPDYEWYELTEHNNAPTSLNRARERLKQMNKDYRATEVWRWVGRQGGFDGDH